jgi:tRNA-2-methylthio-N6-dimethylallyladenosine synthase
METLNKVIDESRQGEAVMVEAKAGAGKKIFLESYGCQMNFSDSEIVASIMVDDGFTTTTDFKEADLILVNTCAIRDNAEQRVRNRLNEFKSVKKKNPDLVVGVLGCMAERLKAKLLEEEQLVDIVVGPDAYRDLPNLVKIVETGQKAVNVLLSKEETYADITPVRLGNNGITAFISITRGCDNMCAFCVVPFTRGRERSRDPETIVNEARDLFNLGYREVTLLGQNVDSYLWTGGGLKKYNPTAEELEGSTSFAELMEKVALIDPKLRVRFSTSHPKDMGDDVLHVMAKYPNICNYIHLPVQSGNTRLLQAGADDKEGSDEDHSRVPETRHGLIEGEDAGGPERQRRQHRHDHDRHLVGHEQNDDHRYDQTNHPDIAHGSLQCSRQGRQ